MSLDIIELGGADAGVQDTETPRAANILSVQLGSLFYAPTMGIDLKYFLDDQLKFQNASFKSYLVQRLSAYSISVASLDEILEDLFSEYDFNLKRPDQSGALVAG